MMMFKLQEFIVDHQSAGGRKNCCRIARHMTRERRDVTSEYCMKYDVGNIVSDINGMKEIWNYIKKLLNVEN